MASTYKTTNLELSQYVSSDKPTYLVDYNSDMAKIDTGVHTAQVTADTASTAATNAQTTAEGAQTTATTAITNAATAQTTANNAQTDIGELANLDTTAKTNLVAAINEVKADVPNAFLNSVSTATNKGYSADFSDDRYKLKHEHAERLIFTGSTTSGQASTINTTWAALGVFSQLVVDLVYTSTNFHTSVIFNFDQMSTGTDLYSGKQAVGINQICAMAGNAFQICSLVPSVDVGTNTIKIACGELKVEKISIIE